ncbi:MAG: serine protease [Actinomycetota bacterium]
MAENDDPPANQPPTGEPAPPTTNLGSGRPPADPTSVVPGVGATGPTGPAAGDSPPTGGDPTPFDELGDAPAGAPTEEKNKPMVLLIGAGALVIALVVALGVLFFGGGDEDEDSESAATTAPATTDVATDTTGAATTAPATTVEAVPEATPDELSRSVVQIIAVTPDGACTGSGTIIDESGVILTNSHVTAQTSVCPWEDLLIATVDTPDLPPQVLFTGAVVADDPTLDLSVVRITGRVDSEPVVPNFPAIEIGDSSMLALGDRLKVLGFPGIGGETITFTEGSISGFVEQPGLGVRSWIKTDTTIAGGNSGGLAADTEGRIVGIPTRAGTDDLDITDCRRVEDTNGDNTIDENDSCIPIGGFINGIRPIDLAADVIAEGLAAPVPPPADETPETTAAPTTAAPTTAPPTTAPPTTAPPPQRAIALDPRLSETQDNGLPNPEIFVVADGTTNLCLTWEYRGFQPGAPFVFGWNINGEIDQGSRFEGTNQGGIDGQFFGCVSNGNGLAPGLYEAIWTVEGEGVFTHGVYVGGGRVPLTIGVQNDTDADICLVRWAPADSVSPGLPHNTEPIPPGVRFETVLPSGVYRTQVNDCNGNVIFEDPGTEFGSDLTLTLPI